MGEKYGSSGIRQKVLLCVAIATLSRELTNSEVEVKLIEPELGNKTLKINRAIDLHRCTS